MLISLMEGVEDIPEVVLSEGLPWTWETFADYLDTLEERSFDVDVATQVPHAALRVYVMGKRGANREPASSEDRAKMAKLAAEGIQAGAFGFSTSRLLQHRTAEGEPIPSMAPLKKNSKKLQELSQRSAGAGCKLLLISGKPRIRVLHAKTASRKVRITSYNDITSTRLLAK